MRSEQKQEIAKAKLKKARQQLGAQANPTQVQVGGGNVPLSPAKAIPTPTIPPAVTPPPANVPRKAQVGRPARVAKPKPTPVNVAVTDPESDIAAPVNPEYDTDELAELPTDSEPETTESEPGEENTQIEEQ